MDNNLTPFEALKAAVKIVGSQQALSSICGVTQTAVWKWLQSSKRLPAEHVLKVEQATGVSRHILRPDIYPIEEGHRFLGVDRFAGPVASQHGRVLLRDSGEAKSKRNAA